LKAKYYPRGELVGTAFPSDVSPTWRAIEHGLALLKKGLIWRIGTGSKICIWRGNWIPRPPSLKVSLKKGRSRLKGMGWSGSSDVHVPHDIEAVLKIRFPDRNEEDFLAWHYERSGLFSVRINSRCGRRWEKDERAPVHHMMGPGRCTM
jgi:hypothetical protein